MPDLPNGGAIVLEYCEIESTECHSPEWFWLYVDELGGGTTQNWIRCEWSGGWMGSKPPCPLTQWAGKTIRLRWLFQVGDTWGNDGKGILIDNVTVSAHHVVAPDCNFDLVPDPCDVALGTSEDCNSNLVPDECEGKSFVHCFSNLNSTGKVTKLLTTGSTNVSCNELVLSVVDAPPGQIGIFSNGDQPASLPFGEGIRGVGGSTFRLLPSVPLGPTGSGSYPIDYGALPPAGQILPGSTWYSQFWYRDPLPVGWGWNLSDGRRLDFGP